MSRNFLFEIGVEEIPARFMDSSINQLKNAVEKELQANRIGFDGIKAMGTPRRLTIIIDGLEEKQGDLSEEVKGPAKKAAYDADGNPTRALQGFAKSQGVELSDLIVKDMGKAEYVFAKKEEKGKETITVLPDLLVGAVMSLNFPKPMRWGDLDIRFIRPVRWIVALFGDKIVPLEIAGVKSDNVSRSHRFLGDGEIIINNTDEYIETLKANYVIVDPNERRSMIIDQIKEIAVKNDVIIEDNEELLDEVIYMIEYPTALMGKFEDKYLALPKESVITPMREHQRYFPVLDKEGNLKSNFVTVRNGIERNIDIVTAGNEKVLRARLADAEFFYQEDLKMDMEKNIEKLKDIVFHITMGSSYDKVQRIIKISDFLADELGADKVKVARTALLAKSDLVSNMVYEFPELQGIMGEYYGIHAGEDKVVAQGIREHYLPRFAGDILPETKEGMIVSIADKIDSVVGFFAMDIIPSGSQDPYALRRQAMGVVQIILAKDLDVNIDKLIEFSYGEISSLCETKNDLAKTMSLVKNFLKQRLENVLQESNYRYDSINAVLKDDIANLCLIRNKVSALEEFKKNEFFGQLMAGFTRVNNLGKKGKPEFDESFLKEDAEIKLLNAYKECIAKADKYLADNNFEQVFLAIADMKDAIDQFLTDIMVMTEDDNIRNSRLGLLASISKYIIRIADLTKLVIEK